MTFLLNDGWFFMVPGRFSWFFIVQGWFFHGFFMVPDWRSITFLIKKAICKFIFGFCYLEAPKVTRKYMNGKVIFRTELRFF